MFCIFFFYATFLVSSFIRWISTNKSFSTFITKIYFMLIKGCMKRSSAAYFTVAPVGGHMDSQSTQCVSTNNPIFTIKWRKSCGASFVHDIEHRTETQLLSMLASNFCRELAHSILENCLRVFQI